MDVQESGAAGTGNAVEEKVVFQVNAAATSFNAPAPVGNEEQVIASLSARLQSLPLASAGNEALTEEVVVLANRDPKLPSLSDDDTPPLMKPRQMTFNVMLLKEYCFLKGYNPPVFDVSPSHRSHLLY